MTYHQDLSYDKDAKLFYVGWLNPEYKYPVGDVSEEFIAQIWEFCRYAIRESLGAHYCEFCSLPIADKIVHPAGVFYRLERLKMHRNGITVELGDGEFLVFGKENKVYYAPNLIYHYVIDHSYLPPKEFVRAVLASPLPISDEYKELMVYRQREFDNKA